MYPVTPNPNVIEGEFAVFNVIVDSNTKIICRAVVGTTTSVSLWQIRQYFNNGTLETVKWVVDESGNPSAAFRFSAASSTGYSFA